MADELYALTKADVDVLRQVVSAWRQGNLGRPLQNSRRVLVGRTSVMFGVASTAIAGTTAALTDPGSGTLNVYKFDGTGTTDTGRDETVYNLDTVSRTTGQFTVCVRDDESGRWMATGGGGSGYKQLCRFVLDAELTDATTSQAALLTNQWGEGTAHSTGSITVYNPLDGYTTGCLFEGTSGTAGLAGYDSGTAWVILQMFKYCS
jgi:hypothetical protein